MKRRALSKRVRFAVLERDGFQCRYCGRKGEPDNPLHVDHVRAVANGGGDDFGNLATACRDCNLGKSALEMRPLIEGQRALALAAQIFDLVIEKFDRQVDLYDFDLVQNFCLSECEPDELMRFVRSASSWGELKGLWFKYGGYPDAAGVGAPH